MASNTLLRVLPRLGPAQPGAKPPAAQGWDRCVLADQVLPGFAKITKGAVRIKLDKKQKAGADGANPTCHGLDPQPIELEINTYTDEDREALALLAPKFVPQKGKKPLPVAIDHPSLRPLGIAAVLIVGVSPLMIASAQRTRMTFDLLHWLPSDAGDATQTPTAAPLRRIKNVGPAANVPPHEQASFCGPPESLQSLG